MTEAEIQSFFKGVKASSLKRWYTVQGHKSSVQGRLQLDDIVDVPFNVLSHLIVGPDFRIWNKNMIIDWYNKNLLSVDERKTVPL